MSAVQANLKTHPNDLTEAVFYQYREKVGTSISWSQLRTFENSFCEFLPVERIAQHGTVLTGPNSAGKTTQIERLTEHGIETTPEFLRNLYQLAFDSIEERGKVRTSSQIIFETGASLHGNAICQIDNNSDAPVVFDRGLGDFHGLLRLVGLLSHPLLSKLPLHFIAQDPDIKSYLKISGELGGIYQEISEQLKVIESWAQNIRYKQVLYLMPLPTFESDDIRSNDWVTTRLVDWLVRSSWKKLGYQLITIPPYFNDIESRTGKIKEYL